MPYDELPRMLLDTFSGHLTPAGSWVPMLVLAGALIFGALVLLRGARLVPYVAVAATLLCGVGIGQAAEPHLPLGPWVPPIAGGAVGLILGIVLVRLWAAVLIMASLAGAALTVYSAQVVLPAVNAHSARGLNPTDPTTWVTLPAAGTGAAEAGIWSFLTESVPNFEVSLAAIAISTGLAGLAFGLLLPKLARATWAATIGTALVLAAAYLGTLMYWPAAEPWLNSWGLALGAGIWLVSAAGNWADLHGWLRRRPAAGAAPAGSAPPAAPAA